MNTPRFWREVGSRYNLVGSKCGNCGRIYFPPRAVCRECHRASIGKMERLKLTGTGTVVTHTTVFDAPKDFTMQVPYAMAIIELDEGVRITGQVIDCKPADVRIGMRVKATFRKLGEDGRAGIIHYGYKFAPAEPAKCAGEK
jgi:uncharacterized OB-fold protein